MRLIRMLAGIGLVALGGQAQASSQSGYITQIAYSGARVFVWLDGTDRAGASCNTPGAGTRYEIDSSTTTGQSQLSIALTTYSLRKRIQISGTGTTCSTDTEYIGYFTTLP